MARLTLALALLALAASVAIAIPAPLARQDAVEVAVEASTEPEADGVPSPEAATDETVDDSGACSAVNERCRAGCCAGTVCVLSPWEGRGISTCQLPPPECYKAGERNTGAGKKAYVPFAPCCDGARSVKDAAKGYGKWCPAAGTDAAPATQAEATTVVPGAAKEPIVVSQPTATEAATATAADGAAEADATGAAATGAATATALAEGGAEASAEV
jgi:hypothetical protein